MQCCTCIFNVTFAKCLTFHKCSRKAVFKTLNTYRSYNNSCRTVKVQAEIVAKLYIRISRYSDFKTISKISQKRINRIPCFKKE